MPLRLGLPRGGLLLRCLVSSFDQSFSLLKI
jgi:hypothetical protein